MERVNGVDVPQSLEDACDPGRLALLVYDMQVGIMRQIADGDAVVARVKAVLETARAAGVRTVFVRHVTLPTRLMGASQLRMWRAWQRRDSAADVVSAFPPEAEHSQIVPELAPAADEAVFEKLTMSAFEGTPLDIVLRDCGVRTYLIAGVAIEVGIEPTVRHSADLGYIPVVVRDACGAGNEAAGARAMDAIAFAGDAMIADTEQVCAALSASGRT